MSSDDGPNPSLITLYALSNPSLPCSSNSKSNDLLYKSSSHAYNICCRATGCGSTLEMINITIAGLQILSLIALYTTVITWPSDWVLTHTLSPMHYISLSFPSLTYAFASPYPTFFIGLSVHPLTIYYLDHGLYLERNDDDRVQRCVTDEFWNKFMKPYLMNRLFIPVFPIFCGLVYVLWKDAEDVYTAPTLLISFLSLALWSYSTLKNTYLCVQAKAAASSVEQSDWSKKIAIYSISFFIVTPLQIAHIALIVIDYDHISRWILPTATCIITGLPTLYIGYTVLECGGFEQSLRRDELSIDFIVDYFRYMLSTCLCCAWLAIVESKKEQGNFNLVDDFGTFMSGQLSFLLFLFLNFMQFTYHRSVYVECKAADKNFQEMRRMREFSAFLFVYLTTYLAGVNAVVLAVQQPDDPALRIGGAILVLPYVFLPLYKLFMTGRSVAFELSSLADQLDTTEDPYETALAITRENVTFEIQGFEEPGEINGFMQFRVLEEHYEIMQKATMRMAVQTVLMGSYKPNWFAFKIFVTAEKGALAFWLLCFGGHVGGAWAGVAVLGIGLLMCLAARPYIDPDEDRVDLIVRTMNFGVMCTGAFIGHGWIDGDACWVAPLLFSFSVTALCTLLFAMGPRRLVGGVMRILMFGPQVWYAFLDWGEEGGSLRPPSQSEPSGKTIRDGFV